jgi:hypothetical protein
MGQYKKEVNRNLGVDYTCVLDVQFGCAFYCRKRFRGNFLFFDTENAVENTSNSKTHIQTAHPKRKCNRPLNNHGSIVMLAQNSILVLLHLFHFFFLQEMFFPGGTLDINQIDEK